MAGATGEGYTVPYPCWILVRMEPPEPPKLVTMVDDDGELTIPVFTDEDLAHRYCDDSDMPDEVEVISAESPAILSGILEGASTAGFSFVAFDPALSTGDSRRVWALDYAIERIRMGLDL